MPNYLRRMRESLRLAFVGTWLLAALLLGIPAALYLPAALFFSQKASIQAEVAAFLRQTLAQKAARR